MPDATYSPSQLAADLALASTTGTLDRDGTRLRDEARARLAPHIYTPTAQREDQQTAVFEIQMVGGERANVQHTVPRESTTGTCPGGAAATRRCPVLAGRSTSASRSRGVQVSVRPVHDSLWRRIRVRIPACPDR
ncbi:hypothetical protein ACQPXH_00175 [Nocardia sp. CA-135953]|uniref:hypothetical protein n=1 Tax=Nocardia sp. CA-135953 TaxID=3239978 RepID=UPI003D97B389